ncbi:MAG: hypothetical protein ACK4JY_03360 [Brevundimonas sp.]|uniref:hypothetical protein n=1 Tax=Brevundimonas sp. TaxID=1871086 RepID=UPI00391B64C1
MDVIESPTVFAGLIGALVVAIIGLAFQALELGRSRQSRDIEAALRLSMQSADAAAAERLRDGDLRADAAELPAPGDEGDKALLLDVLRSLKDHIEIVVEEAPQAFGSAPLAELARTSWRDDVAPIMQRTIDLIDNRWSEMRPHLAEAGLTGAPLRFKALAFRGEVRDYERAAGERLRSVSDDSTEDGFRRTIRDVLRWPKLSKVLEAGDIVWESAAVAVSTYFRVTNAVLPDLHADSEVARHSVTEFKKMTEMVLKRFRPGR